MESREALQLIQATQMAATATMAAAIIAVRGRPISVQEALDIQRDIFNANYPEAGQGYYQDWAKTRAERLAKIHE